jgi:hypothetical protein
MDPRHIYAGYQGREEGGREFLTPKQEGGVPEMWLPERHRIDLRKRNFLSNGDISDMNTWRFPKICLNISLVPLIPIIPVTISKNLPRGT